MNKPTFLTKFFESPADRFEMVLEIPANDQASALTWLYQHYPQATEVRIRQMTEQELYE